MQSVCPIHDGNLNYKLSFETEKLSFDKGKKINSNFHFNAVKKKLACCITSFFSYTLLACKVRRLVIKAN